MTKFEDRNRIVGDDELMFKMQDVLWYKTESEIIPFVVNNENTKAKVLSSNKIIKIIFKERTASNCPADDDTLEIVEDFDKTLLKATGEKGNYIVDRFKFLKKYYFTSASEKTIYTWMTNTIKSQSEILHLGEILTKNYKKSHEKRAQDSRDF